MQLSLYSTALAVLTSGFGTYQLSNNALGGVLIGLAVGFTLLTPIVARQEDK